MRAKDLRVVKTKKAIYQALTHLLKDKRLTDIKVSELCREASINRGTFYFHYEEVGDVFKEFFEEVIVDLEESYKEPYKYISALQLKNSALKNLDPKTVRIFHHVKKYEDFYRIILSDNVSTTYYYMFFDAIRSNFMEDSKIGKYDESKKFVYSFMTNAIIGLIIEWYRNDFEESVDVMNLHLVETLNVTTGR
ncbi:MULTISPECIES: TetR/AcrR family transcriptional regulator [Psychrobacillus]|uniref:TetR/AcrR family transcriptional regulator n=1 Tax=Psychrobacillus TaxID=1221880 RepID=UPI0008F0BA81|nr:TetR/AcrR family transcriptional regulator [Psychrobacillus psychrodurans]MCZ8540788.1 TetR/AcrR family transcriptional regulator [Psychrobacillus psychrodurans]SFM75580.1 Transcriptional regulator C-terminal region [Psychrobacillus psychrodurans]